MKKIILSLTFAGLTAVALAQHKGIVFEKKLNWAQIKAEAKRTNKYVFVDLFATWCMPCKQMDREVYPSDKLGIIMKEKFICLKVQGDRNKNDDPRIKSRYNDANQIIRDHHISMYPTLLYFSPDGKLIAKEDGFKTVDELIKIASDVVDSSENLNAKAIVFKEGRMDFHLMPELALKSRLANEKEFAQKVANKYIEGYLLHLKEDLLFTRENLEFMESFLGDTGTMAFNFFNKDRAKINEVLGYYRAEYAVMTAIDKACLPPHDFWIKSNPDWDSLERIVTVKFGSLGCEVVRSQRLWYYMEVADWKRFGEYYILYLKDTFRHPRLDVNTLSWKVFLHVDDPKVLEFAHDVVMKYAIEEWYPNLPQAYDTYASLLYKTGNQTEAIKWEKRAARLSNNQDVFLKTIEKMEKGTQTW